MKFQSNDKTKINASNGKQSWQNYMRNGFNDVRRNQQLSFDAFCDPLLLNSPIIVVVYVNFARKIIS